MSLCLSCGLCCDGTLFAQVPITPDEAARLEGRVTLSVDRRQLLQGCRALEGCRCGVYDERPSTCRHYRCVVLKSLEAGRLTEADARAAIAEVFALRQQIADAMNVADAPEGLRRARASAASGTASPAVREALQELTRVSLMMQLPLFV